MKRVVLLGGLGLFGQTVAEQLRLQGIETVSAGRREDADLRVDANDQAGLRRTFSAEDLVIDLAGPFQRRSPALLRAAVETGFDVVDLNDDLGYAEQVLALEDDFARAKIRVLSSASSVSAIAASVVRWAQIESPVRVTAFLAPASRHTANRGSALSLIQSLGSPIRIFRGGQLRPCSGWSETRRFMMPSPVGPVVGHLFESADAIYLPRIWPSLTQVDMYVDPNTPGVGAWLTLAARLPPLRWLLAHQVTLGTWISRKLGSSAGGVAYEVETKDGDLVRLALLSGSNSYTIAVAPVVLAARAILSGRFAPTGLVFPDRHIDPRELLAFLRTAGVHVMEMPDRDAHNSWQPYE